jgi:hypothetical protein
MAIIGVLIDIHLLTGDERFLSPIPAVVAWLDRARTGPSEWARFYEIGTGRPLYSSIDHVPWLRYTRDDELYPGYAQWGSWSFATHRARWKRLQEIGREALAAEEAAPLSPEQAAALIEREEQWVREVCAPDGALSAWADEPGKVTALAGLARRVAGYLLAAQVLHGAE